MHTASQSDSSFVKRHKDSVGACAVWLHSQPFIALHVGTCWWGSASRPIKMLQRFSTILQDKTVLVSANNNE